MRASEVGYSSSSTLITPSLFLFSGSGGSGAPYSTRSGVDGSASCRTTSQSRRPVLCLSVCGMKT